MKKRTSRFFIFLSVIIIIVAIVVLVLSAFLISRKSVLPEGGSVDYIALAVANRKLQNEFTFITKTENYNNIPKKVVFSLSEVNALLAIAASGSRMLNMSGNTFSDIFLVFDRGIFCFSASKKFSFSTPFGRYINIRCKFKFNIEKSGFKINIMSIKVGGIFLPKFLIDYFLSRKQEIMLNIPFIHKLTLAIREIHTYKDKLVIVYYPKNLRKAIFELMP
jgi:hypothetical protein